VRRRVGKGDAMCIMKMNRLSMAEAEKFIAALWRTLEEHGIPSPQLRVRQAHASVNLSIEFRSQKDRALVRRVMPCLAAAVAED
jgi:hypothetical protein